MLELINRARESPADEAQRLGIDLNQDLHSDTITPQGKQPLAPNLALSRAAELHSLDLLAQNYFSHDSLDGRHPWERAEAEGYPHGIAENLAIHPTLGTRQKTVQASHDLLFRSEGHRENMLRDNAEEIGLGVEFGEYNYDTHPNYPTLMTTQKFGFAAVDAAITGVVFNDDEMDDDFYTIGEGRADLRVQALGQTGETYSTKTNNAGGYSLQVPSGTYQIRLLNEDGNVAVLGDASISDQNVKIDGMDPQFSVHPASELLLDTSRDGWISPIDAFLVINSINARDSYMEEFDTSQDGRISPIDVLLIVNYLNANQPGSGEQFVGRKNLFELPKNGDREQRDWHMNFAREALSLRHNAPFYEIQIHSAERVMWSDLNLEMGGIPCQAMVPGYRIVLSFEEQMFEYRGSDFGTHILLGLVD